MATPQRRSGALAVAKPTPAKPARKATEADALLAALGKIARGEMSKPDAASLLLVVGRAGAAAMAQSKAEAAWDKADGHHPRLVQLGARAENTLRETCAAGAALAKALRGMRGGK